jgi:hypothetical protein
VRNLVDDSFMVRSPDLDAVGRPAGVDLGIGSTGWSHRQLVTLGAQTLEGDIQSGNPVLLQGDEHQDGELATEASHAAGFDVAAPIE